MNKSKKYISESLLGKLSQGI